MSGRIAYVVKPNGPKSELRVLNQVQFVFPKILLTFLLENIRKNALHCPGPI